MEPSHRKFASNEVKEELFHVLKEQMLLIQRKNNHGKKKEQKAIVYV